MSQQPRILIVEDDVNLLEGVRTILELEYYDVLTAQDGVEALEVLGRVTPLPDVIISDIMMPRMDGIQLLDAVRKNIEWLSIPFIFLTARGDKADIIKGKRLGVDDYLIKPFDAEVLLSAIESRIKSRQLIKQAQNEEISDLKRKILTILNHEFRTPLTFLVAYTDMLNEQQETQTDDYAAIFLRGINTGAHRLRRLIENFIHLVDMEMGDAARMFEMRKTLLSDFRDLLKSACETFFEHNPHREYAVVVEPNLPAVVIDPVYFNVALIQLLENACKFSAPDSPIELGASLANDEVVIWIRDHGRGISTEEQEHIWEAFYQINRSYFEDQGAGAGLAIVRGVARLHGGKVALDSEVGKGTTFKMLLPVVSKEVMRTF